MPMTLFNSDTHLLPLLLHDLISFCSFITCHPLQCAYLLFFSPYILQLLSFLSPLLLSTSLLLLALLTVSPPFDDEQLPGSACRMFVDILKDKLEANSTTSLLDNLTSMFLEFIDTPNVLVLNEKPTLEQCLDKIVDKRDEEDCSFKSRHQSSRSFQGDHGSMKLVLEAGQLQRDGSMRKEKEWKRTLACKLYEERMTFKLYEERKVADGCEEMDLLWEAYEADSSKSDKSKNDDGKGKKNFCKQEEDEDEEEDDDNDNDTDESVSRFCCLQALKLSTGKMNLGMRRPNLMKISNAMKGMGLFRRSRKHGIRK